MLSHRDVIQKFRRSKKELARPLQTMGKQNSELGVKTMNNIFKKIKFGKNSVRSAIFTGIIEVIVNVVVFIMESIMGDVVVNWLKTNGISFAGFIDWIITYPRLSSVIFFLLFLSILTYLDWKNFTEKTVPEIPKIAVENNDGLIIAEHKGDIYWDSKKKDEIISETKVVIFPSHDELEKDCVFKRIQLINQDYRKLLSCHVTATSFSVSPRFGNFIRLASDNMVWSKSNSGVSNNKIDLVEGIPINLYVARVNPRKKTAEIVGINGLYTPIKKGLYSLDLRLDGNNFEPHAFSVTFYYDGKKSVEIKNVSRLSKIMFLYTIQVN